MGCRIDNNRQWALRCAHQIQTEEENGKSSSFITLTHSDQTIPDDGSLDVAIWQRFAKRLRKRKGSFKYFHAGEYTENWRPHYHAILFGMDFEDKVKFQQNQYGDWHYTSEELADIWGQGFVTTAHANYTTASYVAQYCLKKVTGDEGKKLYGSLGIKPPYITMSRGGTGGKGGIGKQWFEKYHKDIFPLDECIHEGKRHPVPRYYDNQINPEDLERYKQERRKNFEKRKDDYTPDRLVVKENIIEARIKRLKRS